MGSQVTFIRTKSKILDTNNGLDRVISKVLPAPKNRDDSEYSMTIGESEFYLGSVIEVRRNENGSPVLDYPHVRYNNVKKSKLNRYGAGPFVFLQLTPLPLVQGVYAVVADRNEILYLGQSADTIRNRWQMGYGSIQPRNCFQNGQSTNCRLNNLICSAILADKNLNCMYLLPPTMKESKRISSQGCSRVGICRGSGK